MNRNNPAALSLYSFAVIPDTIFTHLPPPRLPSSSSCSVFGFEQVSRQVLDSHRLAAL